MLIMIVYNYTCIGIVLVFMIMHVYRYSTGIHDHVDVYRIIVPVLC